jgi:hypothetical protein
VVAVAEEVVVAVDNASSVGTIEGAAAESMTVLVLVAVRLSRVRVGSRFIRALF